MKNKNKRSLALGVVLLAITVSAANAGDGQPDYTKMSAERMAEYLIFEADSFALEQKVQEGGNARSRMTQDETQKACSVIGGSMPDVETLAKIAAEARNTIGYPEMGIRLGDWKKGAELAWSGFGYRIGQQSDDHGTREPGGNCYNCHEMSSDRTGGTIGPDLRGYGKTRGNNEASIRFAFEMIYNPHATFPCSAMPRFGYKNLLSEEQIGHLLAFLFDPASPVNQ
ncbi:MAG: sulfur oxidation c-type cytochrome SoxX [Thiohalomonadaceae bacterium]